MRITFRVIDKTTGLPPNPEHIALSEEWAKGLTYCDMEGFFISENGQLYLLDECGNWAAPEDPNRFKVEWIIENDED